jgi:riboflavin biosynthesis pyrimidine reductase
MVYIKAFFGSSINGYISYSSSEPAKFSSSETMKCLKAELGHFDAILIGSSTIKAYKTSLSPGGKNPPIQIVYSKHGNLDSALPFFSQKSIKERWLLHTSDMFAQTSFDKAFHLTDWQQFFEQNGLNNIACLGGSKLFDSLLSEKMVDQLELCVSPLLISNGVNLSNHNVSLKLLECTKDNQEVILNYKIIY